MARAISISRYRNIGILASQDAGRTTTTERLLAVARQGAEGRAPETDGTGSWLAADGIRAITLTSAATSCEWRDNRINIVELSAAHRQATDGLVSVLDGLVIVIDAAAGVTPKAEIALALARRSGLPRLVFVNKLDLADADLSAVMADLTADCPATPILIQLPLGAGLGGLADLIDLRASMWSGGGFDVPAQSVSIPDADMPAARTARLGVISALGLSDSDTAPSALRQALRQAVLLGKAAPVLCGSAFRNRGISALLDAVVDYLPAASEIAGLSAHDANGLPLIVSADEAEPFVGIAFRKIAEPGQDCLTFVRVYAGRSSRDRRFGIRRRRARSGSTGSCGSAPMRLKRLPRLRRATSSPWLV